MATKVRKESDRNSWTHSIENASHLGLLMWVSPHHGGPGTVQTQHYLYQIREHQDLPAYALSSPWEILFGNMFIFAWFISKI